MSVILAVGAVDTSIDVQIVDDTGLPVTELVAATFPTVKFSKGVGADVTITLSDLALLTTAHTDGGVKERGEGVYRLDLPDAVASTAAPKVTIRGEATNKRLIAAAIQVGSVNVGEFEAAALAQLTAVGVRLFSRQPRPGQAIIVQYDEWTANNDLLTFTDVAGTTWPEMNPGTTVVLRIEVGSVRIQATGTLVDGLGANKEITVALPRADTGSLPASLGKGIYQLLREPGTANEWLLDEGEVIVTKKIAAP